MIPLMRSSNRRPETPKPPGPPVEVVIETIGGEGDGVAPGPIYVPFTLPGERVRAVGAQQRQSYLGRMGHFVEPVFAPLGWDWKVSMAVIASFPAREVVVGTLGVIYDLGDEADAESESLRQRLKDARWESGPKVGRPVFDLASALALMVFFALCAQCASTLVVIRRETGRWAWAGFTFVYMTALAWLGAWITVLIVRAVT